MKVNDRAVWSDGFHSNEISEGVIRKTGPDHYYFGNNNWVPRIYCFPIEARNELQKVLDERKRLKKEYDDSIKLIYELRNKYSEVSK